MAVETLPQSIDFNDCWPVPADFAGNPVRSITITIKGPDGAPVQKKLRNLRPTGRTLSILVRGMSPTEATSRQRQLAATLRDADGHGAHFSDTLDAKWRTTFWDNKIYSSDSREEVARKGAAMEIGRRECMKQFGAELGDVNALAQLETGLYVAFRHPESTHPRILALARYSGVELDDHEHDIRMVPLVLGRSALGGDPQAQAPMSTPLPRDNVWPFVEIP